MRSHFEPATYSFANQVFNMKIKLIAILLPMLLAACAQKSIIEYSQQDRVAMVIIGLSGNTSWSEITSTDYNIHSYKYPDIKANDVILMPVSVGTRFQILEMSQQSGSKNISRQFKSAPKLNIYKDQIYYYGVVQSYITDQNQLRTRIITNVDNSVIERAKQKYPEVFQRKPDIQFHRDELQEGLRSLKERDWEDSAMAKYLKSKQQRSAD